MVIELLKISQKSQRERKEDEETTEEYTSYVVPDHVAIFNQRVEEALRPPILN